ECFAFFAKAKLHPLASLAKLFTLDVVAKQNGDGPGLPAVLSPPCVRAIVVQPVFKGDDMSKGIQRPRFTGVLFGKFQELYREWFDARGDLLSLLVCRSLPVRLPGFCKFLEKRSVLFRGRDLPVLCRRHQQVEDKNNDYSHDAALRLITRSELLS